MCDYVDEWLGYGPRMVYIHHDQPKLGTQENILVSPYALVPSERRFNEVRNRYEFVETDSIPGATGLTMLTKEMRVVVGWPQVEKSVEATASGLRLPVAKIAEHFKFFIRALAFTNSETQAILGEYAQSVRSGELRTPKQRGRNKTGNLELIEFANRLIHELQHLTVDQRCAHLNVDVSTYKRRIRRAKEHDFLGLNEASREWLPGPNLPE